MTNVRFGPETDMCVAKSDVRFTPNSDRKSGFPQTAMSTLPPKADMCAAATDVRCVPMADKRGEPLNGGYVANIVAATTHDGAHRHHQGERNDDRHIEPIRTFTP